MSCFKKKEKISVRTFFTFLFLRHKPVCWEKAHNLRKYFFLNHFHVQTCLLETLVFYSCVKFTGAECIHTNLLDEAGKYIYY
jgi:hypothetical protein